MKHHIISAGLLVLLAVSNSFAATNYVVTSDDFQSKINASAPDDTLVVQEGVYPGNLAFDRPLTVLCSGTNIQLLGGVQIQSTGTVAFSQCQFLAPVQVLTNCTMVMFATTCSSNLTLSGSATLRAFDSTFALGLSATGGKVTLKRCGFSWNIGLDSTAFEGLRLTGSGTATISASAPVGSATPFVLVQSFLSAPYHQFVTFGCLYVGGCKVWLGYNTFGGCVSCADSDAVMVGNRVTPNMTGGAELLSCTRGSVKAYNNYISGNMDNTTTRGIPMTGLALHACTSVEIANNSILCSLYAPDNNVNYDISSRGVYAHDGATPVSFRGNVLRLTVSGTYSYARTSGVGIQATNQQMNVSYSDIYWVPNDHFSAISGVSPLANCRFDDPGAGGVFANAGPPDAIYSNRDGSRNHMGYTGGPVYDPTCYTTNAPMVFLLTSSPQTVFKGAQSTIQINAAASAGH